MASSDAPGPRVSVHSFRSCHCPSVNHHVVMHSSRSDGMPKALDDSSQSDEILLSGFSITPWWILIPGGRVMNYFFWYPWSGVLPAPPRKNPTFFRSCPQKLKDRAFSARARNAGKKDRTRRALMIH